MMVVGNSALGRGRLRDKGLLGTILGGGGRSGLAAADGVLGRVEKVLAVTTSGEVFCIGVTVFLVEGSLIEKSSRNDIASMSWLSSILLLTLLTKSGDADLGLTVPLPGLLYVLLPQYPGVQGTE